LALRAEHALIEQPVSSIDLRARLSVDASSCGLQVRQQCPLHQVRYQTVSQIAHLIWAAVASGLPEAPASGKFNAPKSGASPGRPLGCGTLNALDPSPAEREAGKDQTCLTAEAVVWRDMQRSCGPTGGHSLPFLA